VTKINQITTGSFKSLPDRSDTPVLLPTPTRTNWEEIEMPKTSTHLPITGSVIDDPGAFVRGETITQWAEDDDSLYISDTRCPPTKHGR
jgi:hypothetical protein